MTNKKMSLRVEAIMAKQKLDTRVCRYIYNLYRAAHEHSPKDPTQRIVRTRKECWFYVFLPVGMIEIYTDQYTWKTSRFLISINFAPKKHPQLPIFPGSMILFIRNVFNLFHTVTGHNCKKHPSFLQATPLGSNNRYRHRPGDFSLESHS